MKITQCAELLNGALKQVLGDEAIQTNELENLVDIGTVLTEKSTLTNDMFDQIFGVLVDRIGQMIVAEREFNVETPSVLITKNEYAPIVQKVYVDMPESVSNPSWAIQAGTSIDQNIFTPASISAKYFGDTKNTYEIDISYPEIQIKSAFRSADDMMRLFSGIELMIRNRRTLDFDNTIMMTLNTAIASTLYNAYASGDTFTAVGNNRAINLLALYNAQFSETLTAADCMYDLNFIKYACRMIKLTSDRLRKASTLFNIGGRVRTTPKDMQRLIMLSEFKASADIYLQSDTFHNEFTALPKSEGVAYWQGTGTDYGFSSTSAIDVQIYDPAAKGTTVNVKASGILGMIFDRYALGVSDTYDRVKSNPVVKGEFINYYYKYDASYFYDYNENVVVFFVA